MTPFIIAGAALLLPIVWWIVTVNRFAALDNLLKESWSNIDVALKRRYDLVPNLVETVKGYAAYEKEVLANVTAARERAMKSLGPVAEQARDEKQLVQALNTLIMRVEAYPDLKASTHFLALQRELANTEDRIAAARRFYNGNVREYNSMLQMFPSSMAKGTRQPAEYFEVDDLVITQPIAVGMTTNR